jgi:hypothetical protein
MCTLLVLSACSDMPDGATDVAEPEANEALLNFSAQKAGGDIEATLSAYMDAVNASLESEGANYRVAVAEYLTDGSDGEAGGIVLAKDVGNKQLAADWVPNDPRRVWSGAQDGGNDDITYSIDQVDATPLSGFLNGVGAAETTAAIEAAMGTWADVRCSDLILTRNPDYGFDTGFVAYLNGLGGASGFIAADIMHNGFTDLNFGGGVLAVAFAFWWVDANGPTDIDGNGKRDKALADLYYDPSWIWGVDGGPGQVDTETIALHEVGHGLSQAHFGTVRFKNDGSLKASPRAVMNALYSGPLRDLRGTDNGGHCSNWAQWPNN